MERRKHKRFKVNNGVYVTLKVKNGIYVTLKDLYYIIGQLIDISKGGGAFLYIANGEKIKGRFNIDLFSGTDAIYLRNMPFKTISDFRKNNEQPITYGKVRRCGGQFDNLTPTQKSQLDYFIKNYTNI